MKIEYHTLCKKCGKHTKNIRDNICWDCLSKKAMKIVDDKIYKELLGEHLGSKTTEFKVSSQGRKG